jgi:hypothetical protein
LWRGVEGEVFFCTNLILNPSPQEKDFEKEEFKSSPLLWRGVGGEVFFAYKPHPKSNSPRLKTINLDQRIYSVPKNHPADCRQAPLLEKRRGKIQTLRDLIYK